METPIFWLLIWSNPQAIQDLDDYQVRVYGCHIEIPPEPDRLPYTVHGHIEGIEEIDHLMRQPPSRSRGSRG